MTKTLPRITALTPEQAAKILAAAYRRQIDTDLVRQVADAAGIMRADGTFSLIEYTAYLAGEATRGSSN